MRQFCPTCGWYGEDIADGVCPECRSELKKNTPYLIPVYDKESGNVIESPATYALHLFQSYPERYFPVPDSEKGFNIKVNGEWNGTPIGKKIQEKNEQLKKKVAGYSHEERNVRADVERQLKEKHAKEGINQ
jgi:hypothetical protein